MDEKELEKIRNYITEPVVQDARFWLNRATHGERTHAEKSAYLSGVYNALALIFPTGGQLSHTTKALEKLLFK